MMKKTISGKEFILKGNWIFENNKIKEDEISLRINYLKNNYLIKISESVSGWETLYQDPNDKRYWELIYEQSELSGGGPPTLINITNIEAKQKYPAARSL